MKKNRQTLDSAVILGKVLSSSHLKAVLCGPISLTELHKAYNECDTCGRSDHRQLHFITMVSNDTPV